MNKVDWSKAPRDTTDYGGGRFWSSTMEGMKVYSGGEWVHTWEKPSNFKDHVSRRYAWPENDERINNIGLNRTEDDMGHYNELREAQSAQKAKAKSKYHRVIKGAQIDVYDILKAYGVTCPAIAHAIKKLLLPGERHAKTWEQDINEAIASLERAKELRND
jgi:hypothetical protein